jgi:hypothetical protein
VKLVKASPIAAVVTTAATTWWSYRGVPGVLADAGYATRGSSLSDDDGLWHGRYDQATNKERHGLVSARTRQPVGIDRRAQGLALEWRREPVGNDGRPHDPAAWAGVTRSLRLGAEVSAWEHTFAWKVTTTIPSPRRSIDRLRPCPRTAVEVAAGSIAWMLAEVAA